MTGKPDLSWSERGRTTRPQGVAPHRDDAAALRRAQSVTATEVAEAVDSLGPFATEAPAGLAFDTVVVELVGGTISRRAIGAGSADEIIDRQTGDARYAPLGGSGLTHPQVMARGLGA